MMQDRVTALRQAIAAVIEFLMTPARRGRWRRSATPRLERDYAANECDLSILFRARAAARADLHRRYWPRVWRIGGD